MTTTAQASDKQFARTTLNAVERQFVKSVALCFPLLADIAHAYVMLFVPTADEERRRLALSVEPHTVYMPPPVFNLTVPIKVMTSGKLQHINNNACCLPLQDESATLGAVIVWSSETNLAQMFRGQIIGTATAILRHGRRNSEQYRHLSPGDGIIFTDNNNRIVAANETAMAICRLLGIGSLIGMNCFDARLRRYQKQETITNAHPWEKELVIGKMTLLLRDIPLTEGKKERELEVRSIMIKEIHHRVKNDLQTAASLLNLAARRIQSPEAKAALSESIDRLAVFAAVHEILSHSPTVTISKLAKQIMEMTRQSATDSSFTLTIICDDTDFTPSPHQINSLALIINELALNSVEHGFVGRTYGTIGFSVSSVAAGYRLKFWDDGNGLPACFDIRSTQSLGLSIVNMLVTQDLNGSITLTNHNGALVTIIIPVDDECSPTRTDNNDR